MKNANGKNSKYSHVGRPTNEEVKIYKKQKNIKIISISLIVFALIIGIFVFINKENIDFDSLMGNSSSSKKQSARIMTFTNNSKKYAEVVNCPSGYTLYKGKNVNSKNSKYYCYKEVSTVRNPIVKIITPTVLKIPYYSQNDYSGTYSTCGGGNLSYKGCLPTNGAMIFSALFNKTITPVDINTKALAYKNVGCDGSSYHVNFLKAYAKDSGLTVKTYKKTSTNSKEIVKNILKKLQTGKCVGLSALAPINSTSGYNGVCKNSTQSLCYRNVGHFVMFFSPGYYNNTKQKDNQSMVYVNDPAKKNGTAIFNKKYDLLDLIDSSQSDKVTLFCKS